MSGCNKYKIECENSKGANSFEELGLVAKLITMKLLTEYEYIFIFGSRWKGNWRYCSDFDFAIPENNLELIPQKATEYSKNFGVKIEFRNSYFFKQNPGQGLKINKTDVAQTIS